MFTNSIIKLPAPLCVSHSKGEQVVEVTYRALNTNNQKEIDAVVSVVASCFAHGEPMCSAAGLNEKNIEQLTRVYMDERVKDELVIVAENAQDGIIGGMLSGDFARTEHVFDSLALKPGFCDIFSFLDKAEEAFVRQVQAEIPIEDGSVLHLFMLGVLPQYRGFYDHHGVSIAGQLVQCALQHGSANNYKIAMTEATNPGSVAAMRKAGLKPAVSLCYDHPPFDTIDFGRGVEEPAACTVMTVRL